MDLTLRIKALCTKFENFNKALRSFSFFFMLSNERTSYYRDVNYPQLVLWPLTFHICLTCKIHSLYHQVSKNIPVTASAQIQNLFI